jgi:prepilin-type N-terminal cleavage/methylation domain-containing protein
MMPSTDRRLRIAAHRAVGFTLIELLVVITVIGILIALLLPAVQAAREAARRMQCGNNVKQLALAALSHESVITFFPTGGWYMNWLGHPDRGFGTAQPGGWIYNILPFIEQQALHDLGTSDSGMTIEDANAKRVATPLSVANCPSRRPAALYSLHGGIYGTQFTLTNNVITRLARSDYAMNGGDYMQRRDVAYRSPDSLAKADTRSESEWDDMSLQTGISFQRSHVTMAEIKDGTSNTFLMGEKYISRDHYTDGDDWGDSATMYCGGDYELLRWTGIEGKVYDATNSRTNLPRQDGSVTSVNVQWFGSAHFGAFNMAFCDGSTRSINYSVDGEVYRRLGNRKDGLPTASSQF